MFDLDTTTKTASILTSPARSRTVQFLAGVVVLVMLAVGAVTAIGQAFVSVTSAASKAAFGSSSQSNPSCGVTTGGGAGTQVQASKLTAEQVERAHIIWQVAHEVGMGDQGAIVGMVTLAQESTWGADPKTHRPDSNVDVGPFQQRALPGWYANGKTVEENTRILMDTAYAARTFFTGYKVTAEDHKAAAANGTKPAGPVGYVTPGLAQVRGWDKMAVTRAAQKVQVSAYPDHYAKHEGLARELVTKFNAEGTPPAPSTAALGQSVAAGPLCDPPGAVDATQCAPTPLGAEKGLTPDGLRVIRCAYAKWPTLTYGGVRQDTIPDHPSGRAIDIMTPGSCSSVGDEIAQWAKANAASLGVDYVIWCQKIWSTTRDSEGWRQMETRDGGKPTANHRDHVHVTVKGNSAGVTTAAVSAEGGNATVVDPLESYSPSAWFGKAGPMWSSGYHTGLDFAAPAGTPIRAAKAGKVKEVTYHSAYGNLVKLDHGDVESWYAHMVERPSISGTVQAGQVIGKVGETGNVSGAHLHMEVRRNGKAEDPDAWLSSQGVRVKGSRV